MILIVMGVAGCGKTSVGQKLAQQFEWPYFEADHFHPEANRQKMGQGQPLTDEDRKPWLENLAKIGREHQAKGQSAVISCSALKRSYRELLLTGIGSKKCVFVYLQIDKSVALERLQSRQDHFFKANLLDSQFATLEEPSELPKENVIWVSVNSVSIESVVERIVPEIGVRHGK